VFICFLLLQEAGKPEEKRHTTVELWKPFMSGKPRLIDIELAAGNEMINIISPLSKVRRRLLRKANRLAMRIFENKQVRKRHAGFPRSVGSIEGKKC